MSSLPPIEGTLSARPFHVEQSVLNGEPVDSHDRGKIAGNASGGISESDGRQHHHHGVLYGPSLRNGTAASGSLESPESAAVAELGLISALGSLSAQAQSLPLSPPTLPGLPQGQGIGPKPPDYTAAQRRLELTPEGATTWHFCFRFSKGSAPDFWATRSAVRLAGRGGNAGNAAMNALNSQDESFQLGMYASEVQNQEQLQMQSEIFDQMMDERSENMREVDTLRNVDMAQRKMDDSITKKFIQSITE